MPVKPELQSCALVLAGRYRSGRLPAIADLTWTLAWKHLVKQLRTACPGFTDLEYGIALSEVLADSRPEATGS